MRKLTRDRELNSQAVHNGQRGRGTMVGIGGVREMLTGRIGSIWRVQERQPGRRIVEGGVQLVAQKQSL